MNTVAYNAVNQYQSTGKSSIAYDDPHKLILRLLNGAIERIAQARGALKQGNREAKGELIGKAIGIINGLDSFLDHDQEGDLSQNLAALYEYMSLRLLQANLEDDQVKLDEVSGLLQEIKSGWEQIAPR